MKDKKQYYVEVTGLNELGANELNEFYKYNIKFGYINPYYAGRHVTKDSKYFSTTKNFDLETTFTSLKAKVDENDKMKILLRDKEVNKWNVLCKDKTSLLQFLKDNIHKNA